jgi:hypothetical protein
MFPVNDRETQMQPTVLLGQPKLNHVILEGKFPRIERSFCGPGINAGWKFDSPGQKEDILDGSNNDLFFSARHFRNKQEERNEDR